MPGWTLGASICPRARDNWVVAAAASPASACACSSKARQAAWRGTVPALCYTSGAAGRGCGPVHSAGGSDAVAHAVHPGQGAECAMPVLLGVVRLTALRLLAGAGQRWAPRTSTGPGFRTCALRTGCPAAPTWSAPTAAVLARHGSRASSAALPCGALLQRGLLRCRPGAASFALPPPGARGGGGGSSSGRPGSRCSPASTSSRRSSILHWASCCASCIPHGASLVICTSAPAPL